MASEFVGAPPERRRFLLLWPNSRLLDKDWIRAKPGKIKYGWYAFRRLMSRIATSMSEDQKFSVSGLLRWGFRSTLLVLIALVPVIFAKIVVPALKLPPVPDTASTNPYYQAGLLFTLLIVKQLDDRIRAFRKIDDGRLKSLKTLAVSLDSAIGEIERQIRQFDDAPDGKARMDAFLEHALKCVEATVQLCTDKTDHGHFCVTLLTFENETEMLVRARSVIDGRPAGTPVKLGNNVIAYLVAKYAQKDAFVIHDFKRVAKFRKQNPIRYESLSTLGPPPYRSILFLPLPLAKIDKNQGRKGVVTIDCPYAYAFLGLDDRIVIRISPYLHLLNVMLARHAFGIQPEA